ncbi:MAG: glycosyltransferase N-terminal domain-containing protein [Pseudomonadota bacterium]
METDTIHPLSRPYWPHRPPGQLVWFQVPHEGELGPVEELAQRLLNADPDLAVLITAPTLPAGPHRGTVNYVPLPSDKRTEVQAFLNHWEPDICVWTRGELQPTILADLEERNVPILLVDATTPDFPSSWLPWSGMRQKTMLRRFDRILAADDDAAAHLKSLGARPWSVEAIGSLEEGSVALSASETDRAELAEILATRPVWYAADLPLAELGIALDAHSNALRRAHRFLLVLGLAREADAPAAFEAATDAGYRVALRSATDDIDSEIQVLVADLPDEHGLWYRLAPLCYIGGTFSGEANRNPFEAAALGSAIVYGPRISRFRAHFERLRNASGARSLNLPTSLGSAISDLSAPDKSAAIAHAAWDVSSSGASVTDRVIGLIRDALDKRAWSR